MPRPQLMQTPSPRSESPRVSSKSVAPPTSGIFRRRRPAFGNRRGGRAGALRAAAVVRADVMAGTTADHEAATLLLHDVGNRGAANRILFLNRVLGADPVGTTFR